MTTDESLFISVSERVLRLQPGPEDFNTDQGSQFPLQLYRDATEFETGKTAPILGYGLVLKLGKTVCCWDGP